MKRSNVSSKTTTILKFSWILKEKGSKRKFLKSFQEVIFVKVTDDIEYLFIVSSSFCYFSFHHFEPVQLFSEYVRQKFNQTTHNSLIVNLPLSRSKIFKSTKFIRFSKFMFHNDAF